MKPIKLIIFDLDGTLLDTLADLTSSVNHAMNCLQMPERTKEEVLSFIGNGNRVLMERCVRKGSLDRSSEELTDLAVRKFHEYYSRHYADETAAYPGILELLAALKGQGLLLAVVSNKADYAVQDLCRKYFDGIFDFVLGDREGIRRKPSSDPVDLVLQALHLTKEEAVYVGDSEVDIETAANAGLPCISVCWGFRTRKDLISSGASVLISSPKELPAAIADCAAPLQTPKALSVK